MSTQAPSLRGRRRRRSSTGPARWVGASARAQRRTLGRRGGLPLVALAVASLLAGCGGSGRVSLAQLADRQQAFAGKRIETQGVVREERDPSGESYFVLSDGAGDLVGLKPRARVRAYAGERVDVRGRFEVEPGFGRVVWITAIALRR